VYGRLAVSWVRLESPDEGEVTFEDGGDMLYYQGI